MWKTAAKARVGLSLAVAAGMLTFGWASASAQDAAPRGEGEEDVASPPALETMEITGTIEAATKNVLGQATQVRIVSQEMGAFLIAKDGKGEELKDHVGATVTVTARPTRDAQGNETLAVERYELHKS